MILENFEHFNFNFLEIIINNSCPLDCSYCFLQNQGEAENMDEQTLRNIYQMARQLQESDHPQEFISLMYGLKEPMVSWKIIKKVFDSLDFDTEKLRIYSTINTNGVLITDEIFQYCQSHNIDLHVSLDGLQDIHDRGRVYRGNKEGSSWKAVMDLIERHPNANYFSLMATIHKQDLGRITENFKFLASLPIKCFVYALNKFDNWDEEALSQLESEIKTFIDQASPNEMSKTRFVNTAAISTNINVINGLKVVQDGTVFLQPPVGGTDGIETGDFIEPVVLGNVNSKVSIPEKFWGRQLSDYNIVNPHCSETCPSYKDCKQGDRVIYVDDFACRRVQHFKRMAEYAKGGKMTDKEYQEIRAKFPIHDAVINLTDSCNLRCPYCFTEHNTRHMDLGTAKAAVNFVIREIERVGQSNAPRPGIAFFGGEPMLRYNDIIVPLLTWMEESGLQEKYNFTWSMTTNGTLFTEENIKFLYDHNVGILLSIDGAKETQDDQRPGANGASSFDMINIPLILRYYPKVTFRSAVEPRNAGKILENYLFARNSGFTHYFITPNHYAKWSMEDLNIALTQLAAVAQVMYNDIKNGVIPCYWDEFITDIQNVFQKPENTEISFNHCGIGTNSVGIGVNGELNGCQEHNTYTEHDIFYIGDIFTGIDPVRHKRLLENFKSSKHPVCVENPELCKTCNFYDSCAGHFCPSHNMGNGGAINNSLASCIWKNFMFTLAQYWVKQADEENAENVINFVTEVVVNNVSEFSIW